MRRRPPRSTPFPYTTLFRSVVIEVRDERRIVVRRSIGLRECCSILFVSVGLERPCNLLVRKIDGFQCSCGGTDIKHISSDRWGRKSGPTLEFQGKDNAPRFCIKFVKQA